MIDTFIADVICMYFQPVETILDIDSTVTRKESIISHIPKLLSKSENNCNLN